MRSLPSYFFTISAILIMLFSCTGDPGKKADKTDEPPSLTPDYSGTVIPYNIAPMNFRIENEGSAFFARFQSANGKAIEVSSRNGNIAIPAGRWRRLLEENKGGELKISLFARGPEGWSEFRTITNTISADPIDPYITYRLLYPGYESWKEIFIKQRSLESFRERSIIENSLVEENCLNCHTYNNSGKTESFMVHMRGSLGGTYFYEDGSFKKVNLKTDELKNGAVYPRWHPSGKFVAFSSNKIVQQFHTADNNKIEVSDLESSIVLYDIDKNEIIPVELPDKDKFMDTYPEWSPDGKMMYFCRAPRLAEDYDYRQTRYDLYRIAFDPGSRKFGNAELVFDAAGMNKSIAFPRVSPEGNYLVMTIQDYGCFPIWHKETDLISLNLKTFETERLELNSDYSESYHSWSSNGKWLLFASRRDDGLTTRPYIAYINKDGKSGKPFIVPQKDPEFYDSFLKSFNVPEFSNVKIAMNPGKIRDAVKSEAVQAKWAGK